jgi:PhnB protein
MAVKPIPDGYNTYTPYYVVEGASDFIAFLKQAFGAEESFRMPGPDGRLGHAEVRIGTSVIMLADANPRYAERRMGGMLYVSDADAMFKRAIDAGAKVDRPLETQFYGDRSGTVTDRWGNQWTVATHVEDVSPEEMDRRMKAMPHG